MPVEAAGVAAALPFPAHPGAAERDTGAAGERVTSSAATTATANTAATAMARRSHLRRARRFASAISRLRENGNRETCEVIELLSLVPGSGVKTALLGGHSGTLAQATARPLGVHGQDTAAATCLKGTKTTLSPPFPWVM